MKIAVKGQVNQVEELKNLISEHSLIPFKISEIDTYDVIFDLDFDDSPEQIQAYHQMKDKLIIVGSVKIQLEELYAELGSNPLCTIIGMNTIPTFINRDVVECCAITQQDEKIATTFFDQLNLKSRFVKSRVGLVTPRIICMIINEAYYTVQEGTASKEDIDLGMKLGTAYPKGPFEWSQEIGLDHVYETLDALYQDTKDERYKIASLLKTEYLKKFIS